MSAKYLGHDGSWQAMLVALTLYISCNELKRTVAANFCAYTLLTAEAVGFNVQFGKRKWELYNDLYRNSFENSQNYGTRKSVLSMTVS